MVGTVGFVGLGNVGGPMSINLLNAGLPVLGFDPQPNAAFVAAGGRAADSIEELAARSTVVIHSLPGAGPIATSIDAMIANPVASRVLIELSSYALEQKIAAAQRLADAGIAMLDCEVSGLPQMVTARKAVIFKSGDAALIESLAPVFDAMADKHFNLGPLGAATKLKLIANTMVCVHNLMAAEALNLAAKAGLDPATIIQVLGPSAAGSNTFNNKAPIMLTRDFASGAGPFSHMFGYLERAGELAGEQGVATPLLDATAQVYAIAQAEGRHQQDIAAILEIVEALSSDRFSTGAAQ